MSKTIVLDPGHGGIDKNGNYTTAPAKMAKVNGEWVYEGLINRQFAGMLGHLLKWDGYNVIYTVHPDDPRDLSLSWRVRVANQYSSAPMISLHSNAFNGKAEGWEIYTSKGTTQSDYLAESIAREVELLYNKLDIKLRYDWSDKDRDKEEDFYVLRKTKGTAVLIETLFFDNPSDWAKLNDLTFRQQMVAAYYKGIKNYIKN
jgi:N-acetylmuramoyl-L-alanine amidase